MTMTLTVFDPRAGQRVSITVPVCRPTRSGLNILFALGTMILAQVMRISAVAVDTTIVRALLWNAYS